MNLEQCTVLYVLKPFICLEVLELLSGFIVDIVAEFSLLESKAAHSLSSTSESQAHRL